VLDSAALIEGGYDLEVSSPGLDRLLRKERNITGRSAGRCGAVAGGAEVRASTGGGHARAVGAGREASVWSLDEPDVTKARLEADVPWPRKA